MVKNLPASVGDMGLVPESRRSPGEGNGNLLQYSCLGDLRGQRSWRAWCHPLGGRESNLT